MSTTYVSEGDSATPAYMNTLLNEASGEIFNVKASAYGATGDGTTDDTTAIQAAIDAAAATKGQVYLPEGTYICGQLTIPSNISIVGAGRNSILKLRASTNDAFLEGNDLVSGNTNIVLANFYVDGNKANQTLTGDNESQGTLRFRILTDSVFTNLYVKDGIGHGIILLSPSRVQITNTTTTGHDGQGIGIGILTGTASADCIISNNHCISNGTDGIVVDAANETMSGFVVEGNVCSDNTLDGIDVQEGVVDSVFNSNVCEGNGSDGFSINGGQTTTATQHCTFSGNVVANNTSQGFLVNDCDHLTFTGNVSRGNVTGFLVQDCVSLILTGNYVLGNSSVGIRVHDTTNTVLGHNITKNNGNYGIRVDGASVDNVLIHGNRCYDDQTPKTQPYGLRIDTSAHDIQVFTNNFEDNLTGEVSLSSPGSNVLFRNNIGYITEANGTATLANGTTSIAVTHGLGATPTLADISVTPIESWGAATNFWITSPTSTQFTINVDQDPTQDVDFAWTAAIQ